MSKKEAAARLKINKLLEESKWRLIDDDNGRANVDVETRLNPDEKINIHEAGEDFENIKGGFIDYLLLDRPIAFTEDDGATWTHLDDDTTVSMNMWGFSKSILDEIEKGFPAFLEKGLKENPMKCEYYLPGVVSDLLGENRATVAVLKSADKWYGVTYKEDNPVVMEAIRKMEEEGLYPA